MRSFFLILPFVLVGPLVAADDKPVPKVKPARDTTFVLEPLTKDGYIDYETALNRHLSKGVKPESNANVLLWRAFGPKPEGGRDMHPDFHRWLGVDPPPAKGDYFLSIGKLAIEQLKLEGEELDRVWEDQANAMKRPWVARDYPEVTEWLKANEKVLLIVLAATEKRDYFNPIVSRDADGKPGLLIGSLLPAVQKCREVAAALTARAMVLMSEGHLDAAWQDLLACLRLGRLMGRGATLIERLVGVAIYQIAANACVAYLDHPKVTAKQARQCLKDVQALPPVPPLADSIDYAERFMFLDCTQAVRQHGFNMLLDQPPQKELDNKTKEVLEKLDWGAAMRAGNVWYDRLAAALRVKDRAEREKALAKIEDDLVEFRNKPVDLKDMVERLKKEPTDKVATEALVRGLVILLFPAVRKVNQATERTQQVHRNLEVAFALAVYQRENGKYPDKLESLTPKLLATIPGDLFSGKELTYRPAKGGYLLYSVGVNGKDENGQWYDDKPAGDDPRVRLPLPPLPGKEK